VGLLGAVTGFGLVRRMARVVLWILVGLLVYFTVTLVQVWLTGRHDEPKDAQAIVVMGAAQYDGVPSPDLVARLDQAALLWHEGYAPLVVVTGSKEPGDRFTEAEAGARYLEVERQIPAGDIVEVGGADSWRNLADATDVLLARGDRDVLLVTDPFHEDRCLAIATTLGLRASPTPTLTSPLRGWPVVPYYLKEAAGVGLGRVIGFDHLSELHADLG